MVPETTLSTQFAPSQDVFLMIRRKNLTIFLDAKETTTIYEVKRMIEGITKRKVEEQQLFKDEHMAPLGNDKTLGDIGFTSSIAKAQCPATLGLCFFGKLVYSFSYLTLFF